MADYIYFQKLHGNFQKPAGKYLVYTNETDGSDIENLYEELFTHIKENRLKITGNLYEDYPLNGIFASKRKVHFIRIAVVRFGYGEIIRKSKG